MSIYSLLAEFSTPEDLVQAAHSAHAAGYRETDAFTPFPVEGLAEALGAKGNKVAKITFIGGLLGAITGFFMQTYANVFQYPITVAGRPDFSWPSFIIITFELTVLFAALSSVFGMFMINKLPTYYHPLFNSERFRRSGSTDGFFLSISSKDQRFDLARTRDFLLSLQPKVVTEVEDGE